WHAFEDLDGEPAAVLNVSADLVVVAVECAAVSEASGLRMGFVDTLEIDDDRVVTVAHDDPLRCLVGRIDLLMRNEGRHIDEVPGAGVRLIFQAVTPPHPDMATDHIDDGLLLAVMVGSGRRI